MRRGVLAVCVAGLLGPAVAAEDAPRYAERTPLPHRPAAHTQERAGNPATVAPWAVPGVSRYEAGGSVGGTFGWDFVGFRLRPGRVFRMAASNPEHAAGYRTQGPHVPDVFSLRPFRRAVLEKNEATGGR